MFFLLKFQLICDYPKLHSGGLVGSVLLLLPLTTPSYRPNMFSRRICFDVPGALPFVNQFCFQALSYEEKEEWKARAKEFNKSEAGQREKMSKRVEYRHRRHVAGEVCRLLFFFPNSISS